MSPELAEVWCANDERPAVVNRMVSRGGGKPELRALCGDCNWKAEAATSRRPRPGPDRGGGGDR